MYYANNYKNVILVGATGNVEKHVLQALQADSSFNITILSRSDSKATFPSNGKVIEADYADAAALTEVLANRDVVISTIGGEAIASNFGEVSVQAAMDAQGVDNGLFDFDIKNRSVVLHDEEKHSTSGTTLPTVGKAVVGVFSSPELTQNKRIYVADATFTQQQALALFEKYTKTKWSVKKVASTDVRKEAEENLAKGNIRPAFMGFILAYIYGGSPATNFEGKTINKAIGAPTVSFDQIIKEAVERSNTA